MGVNLAISTYSFRRFAGPETPPLTLPAMIERCAALGVQGIEILGREVEGMGVEELNAIKRCAAEHGIAIVSVAASHNFVLPDAALRAQQIDIVARWVEIADRLGAPFVRVLSGRWNTLANVEDFLMKNGGNEPPLPGYTDDDAFQWVADSFKRASYHAGQRGVTLVLENHWGLTRTAAGVLRIIAETGSPWLQTVLDTGNFHFRPDQYADMAALLPHVVLVHAKTYPGGGIYFTADLDYPRIAAMLRQANYHGYVSVEFEGAAHPDTGIPESIALLRAAFAP
jgi:L-ribulose-5-phosphate 3-epimerase